VFAQHDILRNLGSVGSNVAERNPKVIVAMACDRSYLFPWAVSLVSAMQHSTLPMEVWFGLASDWRARLSERDISFVLSLIESTGASAQLVEVTLDTSGLPSSSYISPTSFVKLALFDRCPSDSQMVWLDSDLVARAPWEEVLLPSMGHAVSGNHEINPKFEAVWPGNSVDWYVNTGVVVVDGAEWQREFSGKWQGYLADYSKNNFRYMDQDVLNATVRDGWNFFSQEYNFRPIHEINWTDPAIVHFSGRYKPWMRTSIQYKLLSDVWRFSFDAYIEAEKQLLVHLYEWTGSSDQRFWLSELRRIRGVANLLAWSNYLKILAQGALKLN